MPLELADVVAAMMVVALTAYALTGGADFGGGVWDLLATGPTRDAQRAHIAESLAPIWEANHVWLIVVVVMLFTGFPAAFGAIATVLHIPIAIALIGIVLRGSAFVFRSYGAATAAGRQRWGTTFAAASAITPFFLGVIVGAIASGRAGTAWQAVHSGAATGFVDAYVAPWLAPFPLIAGLLALTLCAFLAAVYLARNAPTDALREVFRASALGASVALFVIAGAALVIARRHAPRVAGELTVGDFALPVQIGTGLAALAAIGALWVRRFHVARVAAAAQATGILWGWVASQLPYILPDALTIHAAAAPRETLVLLLIGLAVGGAVLIPSLLYLFRLFDRPAAG